MEFIEKEPGRGVVVRQLSSSELSGKGQSGISSQTLSFGIHVMSWHLNSLSEQSTTEMINRKSTSKKNVINSKLTAVDFIFIIWTILDCITPFGIIDARSSRSTRKFVDVTFHNF